MLSASSPTSRPSSSVPVPAGSKGAAPRGGSKNKTAAVELEAPKQVLRRLLKVYEHHCAADDSLALPSIKKTLRAGMQQKTLQEKVNTARHTVTFGCFPLIRARLIVLQGGLSSVVDTLRNKPRWLTLANITEFRPSPVIFPSTVVFAFFLLLFSHTTTMCRVTSR